MVRVDPSNARSWVEAGPDRRVADSTQGSKGDGISLADAAHRGAQAVRVMSLAPGVTAVRVMTAA